MQTQKLNNLFDGEVRKKEGREPLEQQLAKDVLNHQKALYEDSG